MEVGTAGYFAVVEPQVNLRVQVVSPPKLPARINEILTGSSHKRDPADPGACLVSTVSLIKRSRDLSDSTSPLLAAEELIENHRGTGLSDRGRRCTSFIISVTIYVSLCGCSWSCCVNLGSNAAVDDGDDDMREY